MCLTCLLHSLVTPRIELRLKSHLSETKRDAHWILRLWYAVSRPNHGDLGINVQYHVTLPRRPQTHRNHLCGVAPADVLFPKLEGLQQGFCLQKKKSGEPLKL